MTKQNKTEETTFTPEEMTQLEELSIPLDLAYTGIPEEEEITQTGIVPFVPQSLTIVENFSIAPNLQEEEIEMVFANINTYTGVVPQDFRKYVNVWVTCLGCVVRPLTSTNEESGEVKNWVKPLFKIIDPEHNNAVIIAGGGGNGLELARNLNNLFAVGDFKRPKQIRVTLQTIAGKNRQTGVAEEHTMCVWGFRLMPQSEGK
jgi:hypothetical protein